MGTFFLDSSSLVKPYIREIGTELVKEMVEPENGNTILIAHIAQVEVAAAISRRSKSGSVKLPDAENALAAFRFDLTNRYLTVDITTELLDFAMSLAIKHALRGYDAVQLAAAIEANSELMASGMSALMLISADRELNEAATAEGILFEDPNDQ